MGLDATVYCDCFEKGRLKEPPPPGCRLEVTGDGSLSCGNDDLDVQLAFDQWLLLRACDHANGVLVHHRIGNIALVAAVRAELESFPAQFPLILSKVICNGVHAGDFIQAQDVPRIQAEVKALAEVHCQAPNIEQVVRRFEAQMSELVNCALRVGKPIAF